MSYQKCPRCEGTGKEYTQHINALPIACTVCKGYKIISQLTGLPPYQNIATNNFNNGLANGDFRDINIETQQEYYGK